MQKQIDEKESVDDVMLQICEAVAEHWRGRRAPDSRGHPVSPFRPIPSATFFADRSDPLDPLAPRTPGGAAG